jgi:hypothetical protein
MDTRLVETSNCKFCCSKESCSGREVQIPGAGARVEADALTTEGVEADALTTEGVEADVMTTEGVEVMYDN